MEKDRLNYLLDQLLDNEDTFNNIKFDLCKEKEIEIIEQGSSFISFLKNQVNSIETYTEGAMEK